MGDMVPQGSLGPHDGPGHDTSDVGIRGVLSFGVILTLVTALTMAILGGWYAAMAARERAYLAQRPPRFAEDDSGQYPGPVLQAKPYADMLKLRSADDQKLNSYSWVDKSAGIARIPISRAIDLSVERLREAPSGSSADMTGLPAANAGEPEASEEPSSVPPGVPSPEKPGNQP